MVQNPFQSRAFYLAAVVVLASAGAGALIGQGPWVAAMLPAFIGVIAILGVFFSLPAPRGPSIGAGALRDVNDGKKPRRPADLTPQEVETFDALDEIAETISDNEGEEDELREDAERATRELETARRDLEALKRDQDAIRTRAEADVKNAEAKARELEEKLRQADEKVRVAEDRERTRAAEGTQHGARARELEEEIKRIERRM